MKRTLKGIRCDLGLSQEKIANKLNISKESYKAIESGRTKLPASVFVDILELADINDYRDVQFKR